MISGAIVNFTNLLSITLSDVIGLTGVFVILWYYFLLQIGKSKPESFAFSFANLAGSILVLISLFSNWNLSSFVIEVAWVVISFCGTLKAIVDKKHKKMRALSPLLPKTRIDID